MLSDAIHYRSNLNRWDKFRLESIIATQYHETYNCNVCLSKDTATKEWRQNNKGCFKPIKRPTAIMDDGTKVYMCLGRMYGYNEIRLLTEYRNFVDEKILPEPGHINYQSSKVIDAFNFISVELEKNRKQKEKENNVKRN